MKLLKYLPLIIGLCCMTACDFAEKNINPNSSRTIEPGPLLTHSLLYTSNEGVAKRIQVGYCMMMVQQTASLERDEMAGDKYLVTEMPGVLFHDMYTNPIKNIQELINRSANDPSLTNTYGVALIWKSFLFQRLTDLYGDIPYSEAANGYVTQNFYSAYDAQKDIYDGMIADIEKGMALFDNSAPKVNGDIIYNGDLSKWKRFGNSLLLKMALRMEKASPDKAKALAQKAIKDGVMQSNNDNCLVKHVSGKSATENPLSGVFKSHGLLNSGAVKISKTFMTQLKKTNDPRLKVYSALPNGDTTTENQRGLPNGYDILSINEAEPSFSTLARYSTFNPATLLLLDAPTIHMTHAETELLVAETILKGWITGSADEHYQKAVRSSMIQQAIYGKAGIIDNDEIEMYLSQQLYSKAPTQESKMNVLATEFWVASFLNGYESYANWRRTGYPVLFPVFYPGSKNKGSIPRRFTYPTSEYSVNPQHIQEGNERQGADAFSTRIWWDKN